MSRDEEREGREVERGKKSGGKCAHHGLPRPIQNIFHRRHIPRGSLLIGDFKIQVLNTHTGSLVA
jgi:hypothetical protein